jgi:hypothetical protein
VADQSVDPTRPIGVRLVDADRVQIEFLIEDLVKQLVKDRFSPIASCNGCNSCSATIGRVNPASGGR